MDLRHLEVEIEHLKKDVQELKTEDIRQSNEYTKKLDNIEKKLDSAISQLDMYRHFTIFIRAFLIGIIMIVTIKFGDIKEFFTGADSAL